MAKKSGKHKEEDIESVDEFEMDEDIEEVEAAKEPLPEKPL